MVKHVTGSFTVTIYAWDLLVSYFSKYPPMGFNIIRI